MELIDALKSLGFTQQEALIYIKLSLNESLTGYEAAKLSGISRSNAYACLSNLVEKGYAHVIDGSPVHYTALPKADLIRNEKEKFNRTLQTIEAKLDIIPITGDPYISITGEKAVIQKIKNIIANATQRIYVRINQDILSQIEPELTAACKKGLKVVILSSADIKYNSHTFYYTATSHSIKLIADTKEILAGTLNKSLHSKNTTIVMIIRESLINEITLLNKGFDINSDADPVPIPSDDKASAPKFTPTTDKSDYSKPGGE